VIAFVVYLLAKSALYDDDLETDFQDCLSACLCCSVSPLCIFAQLCSVFSFYLSLTLTLSFHHRVINFLLDGICKDSKDATDSFTFMKV
jgi:hypothetical protein